ncbi:MAG TPA: endonuclease MutS2, partial [Blastocatellia bacterium]|nr:endonuclease MutS2 [Blastocatellia bacterium]
MDELTYKALEVESLIALLAGYVQSPLGRARVERLTFSTDASEIDRNLDLTSECRDHLTSFGGFSLSGITDPEGCVAQLAITDARLDPHQIIVLERLLSVGVDLRGLIGEPELRGRFPRLAAVTGNIPDLRRVLATFRGKILPNGEIDDSASPTLRRIRREINERRAHIYRSLESLMRDHATSIQEEIVTIRSGRFVVPVRTDSRGQVQGVVHGLSSSGQTTYVEPLNVINQNNDLVRLHEEEEIEISRILMEISETLRANLPAIRATIDAAAEVDYTQAKARLALDFNCVRPKVSLNHSLVIRNARHLLLENMLRRSGGTIVPVSLEMDEAHQVLVISGPNAGGKTVVLKTVGLLIAMAQMGLHVPAEEAALPLSEQVFADIGDQQSIAANLSTFTAHM